MGQDPAAVAGIVGRHPKLAAVGEQRGEAGGGLRVDDPSLPVAFFRPGIGEQHEDPLERRLGQAVEQQAGVVDEEADVLEILRFDLAQEARHAVEIGLDAEQPDVRVGRCLPGQVLATAEADFQPEAAAWRPEEGSRVEIAGLRQGQGEEGQLPFEPFLGLGPEPRAALAPIKNATGPSGGLGPGAVAVRCAGVAARRLS